MFFPNTNSTFFPFSSLLQWDQIWRQLLPTFGNFFLVTLLSCIFSFSRRSVGRPACLPTNLISGARCKFVHADDDAAANERTRESERNEIEKKFVLLLLKLLRRPTTNKQRLATARCIRCTGINKNKYLRRLDAPPTKRILKRGNPFSATYLMQ